MLEDDEKPLKPLVALLGAFDEVLKFRVIFLEPIISVPKIASLIFPTPATIRPEIAPFMAPPIIDRPVKPFIKAPVIADAAMTDWELVKLMICTPKIKLS